MINAEIDKMLQDEENDLYDEYMKDPEFAAQMKNEDEKMELTERIAELESKMKAIIAWLEANQPDVFSRGLWDVIMEVKNANT